MAQRGNRRRPGQIEATVHSRLANLRKDPVASTLTSKLVRPQNNANPLKDGSETPGQSFSRGISDRTTQSIDDATNIFQLLPDTELAMQILVSSILSPKDMVNVELNYSLHCEGVGSEITGQIIAKLRNYFEDTYKIKTMLPPMLEDMLFRKGSHPIMVLPESTLDHVINSDSQVSLESLQEETDSQNRPRLSIGLLGSTRPGEKDEFSLESMLNGNDFLEREDCVIKYSSEALHRALPGEVTVTDNFNLLKMPSLIRKMRQDRMADALNQADVGFENRQQPKETQQIDTRKPNKEAQRRQEKIDAIDDVEFASQVYPKRRYNKRPYVALKTPDQLNEPTKGHPIVMKLPPESLIPVHVPSDPSSHIGYFLLQDTNGHPISRTQDADYYKRLNQHFEEASIGQQLAEAANRMSMGRGQAGHSVKSVTQEESVRLYARIVEQDLLTRLKNGVYGDSVEISRPLEVYRVMFARALSKKKTQILYVPAELVTYFAFDYMDNGVGKSLLENNKVLASMRSVVMFANTMSMVNNSTGRTSVNIELSPEETDPQGAVDYMMSEFMRNKTTGLPIGTQDPIDMIEGIKHANVDVTVTGNSGYPGTRMNVDERGGNKPTIDQDLMDELKTLYFTGLSISPQVIDESRDVEFATSVVTSNILMAKRVGNYQDKYGPQLSSFIQSYTRNSRTLWDELVEIIETNKKDIGDAFKKLETDQIVDRVVSSITVTLPKPDTARMSNLSQSFEQYTRALNDMVDAYLGEDGFMLSAFDDVSGNIRAIRAAIIAHFQREWLRENNVLPELQGLTQLDGDENPMLDLADIQGKHMNRIGKTIAKLLENLKEGSESREKILARLEETDEGGTMGGGIGQGGGLPPREDSSPDDGGDDGFGGLNF